MVWCQKTGLGPSSAFRRDDSGGGGHGNGDGCLQGTREATRHILLTTAARTRCHVRDCQKIIIPVGRTGVKIIISTGGNTCNHNVATQIVNQKECAWIDYKLHQNTSLYQTLEGTPLRRWWAWFRARKCR